ncbi:thiamine pyrophosphate-dependent dehydrogenase E1 component subunit alpha [Actinocorallia sp. A-T 12471]|uniref:thiamine pyrophosphate-dependent dehydrogenase E1 component subunit alpha n=1 Tax=Actinocorallia sp. A-T 12471 TaxID=3089813 RepID=UPI0029CE6BAC|nr:thiamine pyrophosphate-dependent dehydrogenase E1 component subunit alpha [Actinocorallia sp. A-T 12471]MDX6740167.1 thiamine pyrophosphate-dependent dehydrogenase E1 component subunit alpha [Actinocorallia sp. A-T 12471]
MTVTETGGAELTKGRLTTLYETMCKAAALDTRLLNGIKRGEFATVIWPSRGQEAIPAALGLALRRDDRLVTTYRGLHDHVAKGVPLTEIIGEVLGTSVGASRGKGGTMHISDPAHGVMMTTGIVGSGVPVAVGLALAAQKDGSDRVTVVTFGDGATNTGSFHEGVNLAATWNLPVVFLCQNNLYAEMTPVEETMAIPHVADRAKGVGMAGVTVDGNDPVATYLAVKEAVDRARAGGGPTLVEAVTFRFEGHYAGDTAKYIPRDQLAEMRERDPMVTFPRALLEAGFTQDELDAVKAAAEAAVEDAVKAVVSAPAPDIAEIQLDVYADGLVVTHD